MCLDYYIFEINIKYCGQETHTLKKKKGETIKRNVHFYLNNRFSTIYFYFSSPISLPFTNVKETTVCLLTEMQLKYSTVLVSGTQHNDSIFVYNAN